MIRSGAPDDTGIRVALKDRRNALKNPYAHLRDPNMSFDMIAGSPMLWDPIRLHEACPSSDGACAMVLTSERSLRSTQYKPAWIHATSMRSEPTQFAGQEKVNPQAGRDCAKDLYAKAGITDPRKQIDMAEIYVPFSWFEPMWLENLGFAPVGEGWKMTYEGATAQGGDMPVNCSGGVLSSNPIGASGMLRFAEAAMQVRGQAGEHQVDGVRIALGHAYGGGSQFFSMWIVGSAKP
jgi:acetyl-CoA C-acetyltransferase